jgi:hypothetical protein
VRASFEGCLAEWISNTARKRLLLLLCQGPIVVIRYAITPHFWFKNLLRDHFFQNNVIGVFENNIEAVREGPWTRFPQQIDETVAQLG